MAESPATLRLLGRPRLVMGGEAAQLPFERRTQLLVHLAARRAWVGRAELAGMLWPEHAAKLAHANLRKALLRVRELP